MKRVQAQDGFDRLEDRFHLHHHSAAAAIGGIVGGMMFVVRVVTDVVDVDRQQTTLAGALEDAAF